jgi:hypothetical protein
MSPLCSRTENIGRERVRENSVGWASSASSARLGEKKRRSRDGEVVMTIVA